MMLIATAAALFAVATLYASVGHGGASGYLAVLALVGREPETIRPTALVLNVVVSSIALARFGLRGYFRWRTFWPFAVTAVPAAFLAGWRWSLDSVAYSVLLAAVLLFAAWRLAARTAGDPAERRGVPLLLALPIGAAIGVVSGLIGVGGGIFLSPILILCAWASARESAAVSAAFILLSSLAGLGGLWLQFDGLRLELADTAVFCVSVLVGGLAGSTVGVSRFNPLMLRRALAVVLVVAAAKMLLRA